MVVPPSIVVALGTRAACVENPGALTVRRRIIESASVDVAAIRAVLPPNVKYEKLQYTERSVVEQFTRQKAAHTLPAGSRSTTGSWQKEGLTTSANSKGPSNDLAVARMQREFGYQRLMPHDLSISAANM